MAKKKLKLKDLKVKSFVNVMNKSGQKTTKGGYIDKSAEMSYYKNNWTTIKTQKSFMPYTTKLKGFSRD